MQLLLVGVKAQSAIIAMICVMPFTSDIYNWTWHDLYATLWLQFTTLYTGVQFHIETVYRDSIQVSTAAEGPATFNNVGKL